MHRSRRALVITLLAALAFTALAAAAAPQSYTLRLHQGEGDKATYAFTATATDKLSGPGAPAGAVTSSAQLTCAIEFQGAAPGGGIVVQARIKEGRVKGEMGGQSQTIPVNTSLTSYVLTPRAEVKQSELLSGSQPQISATGMVFTADDAFLPPPLPDKPVKLGDRWQSSARIPGLTGHPGDVREAKYDSKVLGQLAYAGRNCLNIKTSLRQSQQASEEAPDGSGSVTVTVLGTNEITWVFDPKAGLVMKTDGDGTVTMTRVVKTTGQSAQTYKVSGTILTHARMTEYNGKKIAAQ
jgi:hypothetical protein